MDGLTGLRIIPALPGRRGDSNHLQVEIRGGTVVRVIAIGPPEAVIDNVWNAIAVLIVLMADRPILPDSDSQTGDQARVTILPRAPEVDVPYEAVFRTLPVVGQA